MDWKPSQIIALRSRLGDSQAGLAERLGVDRSSVSRWETGAAVPRGAVKKLLEVLAGDAGDESRTAAVQSESGSGVVGDVADLAHDGENAAAVAPRHVKTAPAPSHEPAE